MQWRNQLIQFIFFIATFSIIISYVKQSGIPSWFANSIGKKILLIAISLALYIIGTMHVDKYAGIGIFSFIIKGILLGVFMSFIPMVMPKPTTKPTKK